MGNDQYKSHRIFDYLLSDQRLIHSGCWIALISSPIYYWIWTVVFPQPYESLLLRSSACGLALLVIVCKHLAKLRPFFPYIWLFSLIYVVPFSHIFLALKNQFNLVWIVCLTFVPLMVTYFVKSAWITLVILTIAALCSIAVYSMIDGLPFFLLNFVDLFPLVPFILGGSLLLNHSNHRAMTKDAKILATKSLAGSIAHEMRNPLSQIHGSLYLIEELRKQSPYDVNPFVAEHIKNAQKAIHSGIQMIDMTMDAINEKPIDRSSFIILSAQAIVKETVKDYAYADADHINRITIEGDDFQLLADPIMVKYLLYNLIQNAFWYIKNSHGGKLVISIFSNTNGFHCIEVRDNGPGIAPEAIPKLFDPFYTTEKQGGTGLGLSYCKRTMTALGGKIDCHSTLGLYTAFVLSFPILGARQIDECAEHEQDTGSELLTDSIKETVTVATEPPAYLVGKTVLLVEDERAIRTAIKALLEQYGMHCVEAENGQEAMTLFSTIDCALIITDLHMPVMNGVDLIKEIRALEETASNDLGKAVPIIVITAEKGNLLSSAIQAGANTFLTKPAADDKLKSTLHRLYAKKYQG